MKKFNLEKVKRYAPEDEIFLNKTISLFRSELLNFIDSFGEVNEISKLDELKMRIHKIKPSCELFEIPEFSQVILKELFDADLNDIEKENEIIAKLKEINVFFVSLVEEINDYNN